MATFKLNLLVLMSLMLASIHIHIAMAQITHTVGGNIGWTVPSTGPSAYTNWASAQTFSVGDTLLFNFATGAHTVAEVAQAAYGPCTNTNPINLVSTGPARLTLNAPGTHYYICTVGTHCQIGQKLAINVSAASPTPSPVSPPTVAPTPSPSPVSPPTAAPTSSPTLAPTPVPSTFTSPPTSSPAPSQQETTPPTSGPSTSDDTSPSPTGSTVLPPSSPSGVARSFTAVVPFTFLAVALAFFF
uniref:cucumber peeling cupredoxin-like n=1 Tax=Erigeron canadensis TaxID=72917 RepID=UPI001CB99D59|nr:cucumber peeling cupredoxin-like [Erigeron canadensis]